MRSYAIVADEFGVSETTVRKWARRHEWLKLAADADVAATSAAMAAVAKTRQQMIEQTAIVRSKLGDELVRRAGDDEWIRAVEDRELRRYFDVTEKYVRLDSGEATDNIAIAEVQGLFGSFMRLAAKWVASKASPAERKEGFKRDVDALMAGGLELGATA
jgi:transposase-like protein